MRRERRRPQPSKPTFLGSLGDDPVHFVGVRDVQLAPLHQLLEVVALVQSTPQACLPGGRVWLVDAFSKLPFKQCPSLVRKSGEKLKCRSFKKESGNCISKAKNGGRGFRSTGMWDRDTPGVYERRVRLRTPQRPTPSGSS